MKAQHAEVAELQAIAGRQHPFAAALPRGLPQQREPESASGDLLTDARGEAVAEGECRQRTDLDEVAASEDRFKGQAQVSRLSFASGLDQAAPAVGAVTDRSCEVQCLRL